MKSRRSWLMGLALGAALFFGTPSAKAGVPSGFTYQGLLEENSQPYTGNVTLTVTLIDQSTLTPVFSQTFPSEQVVQGIFNVVIGSGTSFPANLDFNKQYLLQVVVTDASGTMTTIAPTELWSAPYAMNSGSVNGLQASPVPVSGDLFPVPLAGETYTGSAKINVGFLPNGIPNSLLATTGITTINNISPDGNGNFVISGSNGITIVPGANGITVQGSGSGVTSVTAGPGLQENGSTGNVILTIPSGGVTASMLAPGAITGQKINGIAGAGLLQDNNGFLDVNVDNSTIGITSVANGNYLYVLPGGIGSTQIANGSVTNAKLQNSTIGLISNGSLNIGGSPISLGSSGSVSLNLNNSNTWAVSQSFNGISNTGAITTGTLSSTGNITDGGNLSVAGTSTLTGNTTVGGTLGVTGATTTNGITNTGAISTGTLTSSGNITDGGNLAVTGTSTLTGNTTIGGTLGVTGASTLNGISNTGAITTTGNITTSTGNITATTGNLSIGGTSTLTGNTTVGGTLGVAGNTTIGGTLSVTGLFTVNGIQDNGILNSTGNSNIGSNASTTNTFGTGPADNNTIGSTAGGVNIINGTNTINGNSTFNGTAAFGSNNVSGSNFTITGGTINGTSIGATTPSTGAFTTLSSTSTSNIGTGSGLSNTFGSGASSSNTFGSGASSTNTFGNGSGSTNTIGGGAGTTNTLGNGASTINTIGYGDNYIGGPNNYATNYLYGITNVGVAGHDGTKLEVDGIPTLVGAVPAGGYELVVNGDEQVSGTFTTNAFSATTIEATNGYFHNLGGYVPGTPINLVDDIYGSYAAPAAYDVPGTGVSSHMNNVIIGNTTPVAAWFTTLNSSGNTALATSAGSTTTVGNAFGGDVTVSVNDGTTNLYLDGIATDALPQTMLTINGSNQVRQTPLSGTADQGVIFNTVNSKYELGGASNTDVPFYSDRYINAADNTLNITDNGGANLAAFDGSSDEIDLNNVTGGNTNIGNTGNVTILGSTYINNSGTAQATVGAGGDQTWFNVNGTATTWTTPANQGVLPTNPLGSLADYESVVTGDEEVTGTIYTASLAAGNIWATLMSAPNIAFNNAQSYDANTSMSFNVNGNTTAPTITVNGPSVAGLYAEQVNGGAAAGSNGVQITGGAGGGGIGLNIDPFGTGIAVLAGTTGETLNGGTTGLIIGGITPPTTGETITTSTGDGLDVTSGGATSISANKLITTLTNVNAGGVSNSTAFAGLYEIGGSTVLSDPGSENILVGVAASTTGNENTVVGYNAGEGSMSGSFNVAVGAESYVAPGVSDATAVGYEAIAEGNSATALGYISEAESSASTAIGFEAVAANINATALGYEATANSSGSTAIGNGANATGAANSTALGNGATVATANEIQLGNTSVTLVHTSGSYTGLSQGSLLGQASQAGTALTVANNGSSPSALVVTGGIADNATGAANGLTFNTTGTATYDVLGTSSTWSITKTGAAVFTTSASSPNIFFNTAEAYTAGNTMQFTGTGNTNPVISIGTIGAAQYGESINTTGATGGIVITGTSATGVNYQGTTGTAFNDVTATTGTGLNYVGTTGTGVSATGTTGMGVLAVESGAGLGVQARINGATAYTGTASGVVGMNNGSGGGVVGLNGLTAPTASVDGGVINGPGVYGETVRDLTAGVEGVNSGAAGSGFGVVGGAPSGANSRNGVWGLYFSGATQNFGVIGTTDNTPTASTTITNAAVMGFSSIAGTYAVAADNTGVGGTALRAQANGGGNVTAISATATTNAGNNATAGSFTGLGGGNNVIGVQSNASTGTLTNIGYDATATGNGSVGVQVDAGANTGVQVDASSNTGNGVLVNNVLSNAIGVNVNLSNPTTSAVGMNVDMLHGTGAGNSGVRVQNVNSATSTGVLVGMTAGTGTDVRMGGAGTGSIIEGIGAATGESVTGITGGTGIDVSPSTSGIGIIAEGTGSTATVALEVGNAAGGVGGNVVSGSNGNNGTAGNPQDGWTDTYTLQPADQVAGVTEIQIYNSLVRSNSSIMITVDASTAGPNGLVSVENDAQDGTGFNTGHFDVYTTAAQFGAGVFKIHYQIVNH